MPVPGQEMDGRATPCVLRRVLAPMCSAGIDLCIDLCFALDMALSFQTAYFSESDQRMIYSQQQIAKKYASGWLIIDLASTLPIDKFV